MTPAQEKKVLYLLHALSGEECSYMDPCDGPSRKDGRQRCFKCQARDLLKEIQK